VLNFWATWCAPCVAEMPSLQRLAAATADLDVGFACVTPEQPEVVRGFVAKRGFTLPVRLLEGDPPACFRGRAIPATFIIDKSGRIVMRHTGAARWDDPGVVAFVRGLAAAPA
jgi:thiol-disulfide isomerase/thioredoxin